MQAYRVRLTEEAEDDLVHIYRFIRDKAASIPVARGYISRIRDFLADFDMFPERGTVRDAVRPGLRVVGFERRVSVAFVIEGDEVVVLRILYAGQQFDADL